MIFICKFWLHFTAAVSLTYPHIFFVALFLYDLYLLHRLGYIYMEVQIRCGCFEFRAGGCLPSSCSRSFLHLSSHILGAATGNDG